MGFISKEEPETRMGKNHDEIMLLRLLVGELSTEEASRWRARMEKEPDLAARYEALGAVWGDLDSVHEAGTVEVPAGWREDVLARLGRAGHDEIRWGAAPIWVRLGAASALAVGAIVGVGLARPSSRAIDWMTIDPVSIVESRPTLAEGFLLEWADETGVSPEGGSAEGDSP